MIDHSVQPDYTFIASPDDDPIRFLLHFGTLGIEDKPIVELDNDYTIYSSENSVYIKNNTQTPTQGNVYIFNIMGQEVYVSDLQNMKLNKIDFFEETGYYIIKVVTSNGVYLEKVFIR
jgi:hypothetical protein